MLNGEDEEVATQEEYSEETEAEDDRLQQEEEAHNSKRRGEEGQGCINHEVHVVTGILEAENAEFTVSTSRFSPSLIHCLCELFMYWFCARGYGLRNQRWPR